MTNVGLNGPSGRMLQFFNFSVPFSQTVFCCDFYGKCISEHGPFSAHIQPICATTHDLKNNTHVLISFVMDKDL